MMYSQDQIDRANQRSIADYFSEQGYECEHRGNETHIRGFGGFYVKDNTEEYYIHSLNVGGKGLVSCLMNVQNMNFPEAIKTALYGEEPHGEAGKDYSIRRNQPVKIAEKAKELFVMAEKADNNKRVFAYMRRRGISAEVINETINQGALYQDTKGNAVFLHFKDGKPCGAEFHGTLPKNYAIGNVSIKTFDPNKAEVLSVEPYIGELIHKYLSGGNIKFAGNVYKDEATIICKSESVPFMKEMVERFKNSPEKEEASQEAERRLVSFNGVAKGTSNTYFEYVKKKPNKAYVFESAIDLMSFRTLHPETTNCTYVSMAGLKPSIVNELLEKYEKVVLCVDNDPAGNNFCKQFAGRCMRSNECRKNDVKDYNDLLCKLNSFEKKTISMALWAEKVLEHAAKTKERSYGEISVK